MITQQLNNDFYLTRAQFESRRLAGTLVVGAVYHITDENYLLIGVQDLTTTQKAQVRSNINASSVNVALVGTSTTEAKYITVDGTEYKLGGGLETAVSYEPQTLTMNQKTQARTNISAGTSNFSGSYNDLSNRPQIHILGADE